MTVDEMTAPESGSELEATPAEVFAVDADDGDRPGAARRLGWALKRRWCALLVSVLVVASASLLVTVYLIQYRPDRQTGPSAEQEAIAAASTGTVALLSYAPETIDTDLTTAQSLMTGDFLTYYGKFTADVVAPAVRERGVKASAQVVDSALMEIRPHEAKVLVFLNQETASRDRPEPAFTTSSVVVSLTKNSDTWLISAFDPV
ncbi:Twin-arginine translocation pathway signal [Mycolicibacterium aurum]|uniref:Twin-arginine translocation pathway signal n=1 Tax=Mycolicibacterium aurum TaxID=1791 RepID=A0A448IR53_MYCAU|nr:hypothetical protein [Mycolicibacterium aurum]VEG54890.1 Twin-arginine translocation pathway signal [Mycolicibacterium aurum]